jgi:hypothetical protein
MIVSDDTVWPHSREKNERILNHICENISHQNKTTHKWEEFFRFNNTNDRDTNRDTKWYNSEKKKTLMILYLQTKERKEDPYTDKPKSNITSCKIYYCDKKNRYREFDWVRIIF